MPWEKWTPPIKNGKNHWLINFGISRTDDSKANWYVVDRVHYYKVEKVEKIDPTPDIDPPGKLAALAFSSGREFIGSSIAKLEKREKVRIVVAGDSISCGAQMGYCAKNYADKIGARNYWWWPVLARRLREFYEYDRVSLMHRYLDPKTKKWSDLEFNEQGAQLEVLAVAQGGFKAGNMLEHIDQVLALNPSLVIWTLGTNDLAFGDIETYIECTREAIGKFRAIGAEVILFTPPPTAHRLEARSVFNRVKPHKTLQDGSIAYMKAAKVTAGEEKCALVDIWGAYMARGVIFTGDLYCDQFHPNHIGHEMIADVVDALITGRDVKIWKYGLVVKGR